MIAEDNENEMKRGTKIRQGTNRSPPFEKILNEVGAEGRFQTFFVWGFMIPIAVCYSIGLNNTILLLTTPDHSCHVPGRPTNSVTPEEWRNLTIPWEKESGGNMKHKSCFMYNISSSEMNELLSQANTEAINMPSFEANIHNWSIVECQNGWDFDKSLWAETPVSQFGWVCDKDYIVTTLFSLTFAGHAIGTLFFAVLSDRYGRKPVFYFTVALSVMCSIPSIFVTNTTVYTILKFLLGLAYHSILQLPFIIASEISGERLRTILTVATFTTSVIGGCLVSLFVYIFNHWHYFILVCHLPITLSFFIFRVIPESPRWFLHRSDIESCERILKRIARINGKSYTPGTRINLLEAQKEETKKGSLKDILVSKVLIKHLILTSLILSVASCLMTGAQLNIHNMKGNKNINYFIIALMGVPGYIIGGLLARTLGRRFSSVLLCIISAAACLLATYVLDDQWTLTTVVAVVSMFARALFVVVYMQAAELFPTSLRSTAYGIIAVIISIFVVFIPPVMLLGVTINHLPYYIFFGISIAGIVLCSFLPETVGHPIPQTLKEAILVGRNQPYFSFIHKWNVHKYLEHQEIVTHETQTLFVADEPI